VVWNPAAEDICLELAGEIDDEDTSLVDRAEERAARFSGYSDHRAQDADQAHRAVDQTAQRFEGGQPILVGHHSERRARKDAEKIQRGMEKAVKMWEQSKYWTDRAEGALRHAKYLERPDVRHRRIKGLESDIRVYRAKFTPDPKTKPITQHKWTAKPGDPAVPHVYCCPANGGGRGGSWVAVEDLPGIEKHYTRWIQHCENRLAYERAMLAEAGGTAQDKYDLKPGGRVLVDRGEWLVIIRVNKALGKVNSVTTNAPSSVHWAKTWKYGVEEIRDYKPPTEDEAKKVKAATKLPPLCNFPGEGFAQMTRAELEARYGHWIMRVDATETHGAYRTESKFKGGPGLDCHNRIGVYLTDEKRKDPPPPPSAPEPPPTFERQHTEAPTRRDYFEKPAEDPQDEAFRKMREALKEGVKVVSAPQLFPTPPELARRMADEAGIMAGLRVLEPSAGTGNLIRAIFNNATGADCVRVVAVEVNYNLAQALEEQRRKTAYANESNFEIHNTDFLECNGSLGKFDRIVMNPPFENGADIAHIRHAMTLLKPGGRLVAICADGPRQNAILKPIAVERGEWEPLPADTFKSSGTGVRTVLLIINQEPELQTFQAVPMSLFPEGEPCN